MDYFLRYQLAICEHVGPGYSLEVGHLAQTIIPSPHLSATGQEAHLSSNTQLGRVWWAVGRRHVAKAQWRIVQRCVYRRAG